MTLEQDQKLYHMARLEISSVQTSDSGEYRAVAKNKIGEGTATINLNFEGGGKPKYVYHTLTQRLSPSLYYPCL